VCIFTHERTKASRGVDRLVMTKESACVLHLITKWAGGGVMGATFKFYTSNFYAVGLHIISVKVNKRISRVKIKKPSFHQVSSARRNLGNIFTISNHCCYFGRCKLIWPARITKLITYDVQVSLNI
jgi:hypothetical protein